MNIILSNQQASEIAREVLSTKLNMEPALLSVTVDTSSLPADGPDFNLSMPVPQAVLSKMLQRDGLIPAIKQLRELTGWGLKESKDYVEYVTNNVIRPNLPRS